MPELTEKIIRTGVDKEVFEIKERLDTIEKFFAGLIQKNIDLEKMLFQIKKEIKKDG